MSETKRRLLLSKWNGFDSVGDLREQLDAKDELIGERDLQIDQLESILTDVKYWLHDWLVHRRLFSNPRHLLRKVEDALG